jgi:hypothetical protein
MMAQLRKDLQWKGPFWKVAETFWTSQGGYRSSPGQDPDTTVSSGVCENGMGCDAPPSQHPFLYLDFNRSTWHRRLFQLKPGEAVTVLGQIKGIRNTTNFDNSPDVHVMPSQYSFSSSRFRLNAVLVTILSLPTSIDFDSFKFSKTGAMSAMLCGTK